MLLAGGGEGLVGALQDALRADVDPGAGRHLAVHGEPQGVEAPKLVPVVPVAHQVGVGDQHARRPLVGREDADRLARLHEQGLVVAQALQGGHDGVEGLPVAGRLAGAAVDHEVLGTLGDLGVQVVHQHAQGGFLLPALAGELRASGRTHHPIRSDGAHGDLHSSSGKSVAPVRARARSPHCTKDIPARQKRRGRAARTSGPPPPRSNAVERWAPSDRWPTSRGSP